MILVLAPPPGTAISGGYLYNEKILDSAPVAAEKIEYRFVRSNEIERRSDRRVQAMILDSLLFSELDLPTIRSLAQRRPLGLVYHHMPSMDPRLSAREQLVRTSREIRKLRHCSLIVATSRYVAKTLRNRFAHRRLRPPTIAVVRPGISPLEMERAQTTSDLRKPEHRPRSECTVRILTVANVHPRKAQHRLLEALERLTHFSWHWDVVGGHESDPGYAERFNDRVRCSPVAQRITVHGVLSPERVHDLYTEADLFALASRFETFGMVFTEAASHAVPSVAEAVGGVPEAISHRESGLLCLPGTSFDKPLAALLRNRHRRRQLASGALRFATTLPDWRAQGALFAEALDRLRRCSSQAQGKRA